MFSRAVIVLLLLSLITGYTESQSRLLAVDPPKCPQYTCRTVHAYWAGNKDYAVAYHVKNEEDIASNGSENTFTTHSVENSPLLKTDTTVDYWRYTTCTPFCGKDIAGKWQATQEVLKSGTKVKDTKSNVPRRPCTATEKGATGDINEFPTNGNINGDSPPGVVQDPDVPPPGGGGN